MPRLVSFALACVLLCAGFAFAFSPPDEELAKQLAARQAVAAAWEVEITFPEYPDVKVDVRRYRNRWVQQWSVNGTMTAAASGSDAKVLASCPTGAFPLPLLLPWQPSQPLAMWQRLGMNNATSGYGFCGDDPCFVYGGRQSDSSAPQVHMHNDDLHVLFLRYAGPEGLLEFSYSDYSAVKGVHLPSKGKVRLPDDKILEFDIAWKSVGKRAKSADFDLKRFRKAWKDKACAEPPMPFALLVRHFSSMDKK